jgi:hypothetical protein
MQRDASFAFEPFRPQPPPHKTKVAQNPRHPFEIQNIISIANSRKVTRQTIILVAMPTSVNRLAGAHSVRFLMLNAAP